MVAEVASRVGRTIVVVAAVGADITQADRFLTAKVTVIAVSAITALAADAEWRRHVAACTDPALATPIRTAVDVLNSATGHSTHFTLGIDRRRLAFEVATQLILYASIVIDNVAFLTRAIGHAYVTGLIDASALRVGATRAACESVCIANGSHAGGIAAIIRRRIALEALIADALGASTHATSVVGFVAEQALTGHALVEVARPLVTFGVCATGAAGGAVRIAHRRRRRFDAPGRISRIAKLALSGDALILGTWPRDALVIIGANATLATAGVADRLRRRLDATVMIERIAFGAGRVGGRAHVEVAGPIQALAVVVAAATALVGGTIRGRAGLDAAVVVGRVAQRAAVVEAHVADTGPVAALGVLGARLAGSGAGTANRLGPQLDAAGVIARIARLAITRDAFVEDARSRHTLRIVLAGAANQRAVVADRSDRNLDAFDRIGGIAESTGAVDALLGREARTVAIGNALGADARVAVGVAQHLRERTGVVVATTALATDADVGRGATAHPAGLALRIRIGRPALDDTTDIAAKLIGRTAIVGFEIAEFATSVDAFVLGTRSLETLGIVGTGAARRIAGIADRRRVDARLIGARITAAAPPLDAFETEALRIELAGAAEDVAAEILAVRRHARTAIIGVRPANLALVGDAEVEIAVSWPIETLRVPIARTALERVGVADRIGIVLRAARVIDRIAGAAAPTGHAFIELAGACEALDVIATSAARKGIVVAVRRVAIFAAALVVAGITGTALAVHALVAIALWVFQALRIVGTGAADKGDRITNRCLAGLGASGVACGITCAAQAVDALIEIAGSTATFVVRSTRATRAHVCVADRRCIGLDTAGVVDRIAELAASLDALVAEPGPEDAVSVVAADAADEVAFVADRRSRRLAARRIVDRITGSAQATDALVEIAVARVALPIGLARAAPRSAVVTVAERRRAALEAARMRAGITGLAQATNAFVEDTGATETIAVVRASDTGEVIRADRLVCQLVTAIVGPRIASATLPLDALVEITFAIEALTIVATRDTCECLRQAERLLARLRAAAVVAGIAGAAPAVDALVVVAGSVTAVDVVGASAARGGDGIAYRLLGFFVTAVVIGLITFPAALPDALIEIARSSDALLIAGTRPAGERGRVADRIGRGFDAARVIVGRTGAAATAHALVEIARPHEALAVIRAGTTHTQATIANG